MSERDRTGFRDGWVRVTAPASSANLGPGFDCLAVALGRHDTVAARVVARGLKVTAGEPTVPTDEGNLAVRAMRATFHHLAAEPPGLEVVCSTSLPPARGLGTSAVALVAGVRAAHALVRADPAADVRLDPEEMLGLAAALEGHPDNVAACLLGGLVVSWPTAAGPRAVRLTPHPDVVPLLFVPAQRLATAVARGALPATVPHRDAAVNAALSALLVHALTERPSLLLDATEDCLHQPYRAAAMPQTAELLAALRADGVAAVVSGAGPAVLALTDRASAAAAADRCPAGWQTWQTGFDLTGATVSHHPG